MDRHHATYEDGLARGREIGREESAALVVKLRDQLTKALEDNTRLRGKPYTQLDAVARQGSHGAVAHIVP